MQYETTHKTLRTGTKRICEDGCSDLENSSIDNCMAEVHSDLCSCWIYLRMVELFDTFLQLLKTVNHTERHAERR